MEKRKQTNRNLLILFGPVGILALLVLTIFLFDQRADVTSGQKGSDARQVGAPEPEDVGPNNAAAPGTAAAPAAVITGQSPVSPLVDEAFARTGVPAQVRAFPRGPNGERRYNAPVISAMPEASRSAPPVPLAMSPLDGRVELLAEEIDLHTKTARRMVLDVAALEEVIAGKTSRILAPLPDGSAILLRIDAIRNRAGMTFTLDGEVEGEPQTSVVQLVVHDGILHGTVARYHIDQHLEYRILSSGYMMVRDLDSSTMSDTCGNPGEEDALPDEGTAPESPAEGEPAPDTPGYVTIDVVVGYDQGARVADGGVSQMEARIIGSVDRMNLAFSNSQVTSTELMLLGTIEDPDYVFPGAVAGSMSSNDELGNLNNTGTSNPALNTVSDYANALGADLKAFIVKQADGSAGIAFRPGTSSITARDYMTTRSITFVHELGHNIGARHSWGDSSSDGGTTVHSYGWRLAPAGQTRVRTIMAYDWGWGSGARIPYFANPDVTYQGARTGQVDGYNATGDSLSDPRYVSGGFDGTHGNGFTGSNPQLGARNAHFILAQAPGRANLRTRTSFQVVTPLTSALYQPGETREIYWTGGDYLDTATITLYKDGLLHSTLATGLSGDERRFSWVIPDGILQGGGYFVRVTRNGNLVADSGNFSIGSAGPQPQTITFAAIAEQLTTASFTLSATGGASGNPVTFAVTAGPAVIGPSNVVSFTGAGSVTITASQAGNASYLPAADLARTFNVTRATATVTLLPLLQTYTGAARTVSATTNPPSLPFTITYNGVSTPPVNAGNYTVVGTINSAMYQGSTSETLVVAKAAAAVNLSGLNQVYNGSPRPVGVTTVPGGLSYFLTYNGVPAAPTSAGSYFVEVNVNSTNHTGATTGTLVVSKAPQTIIFPALGEPMTTATVNLAATGGDSGNPVTYAVTAGPGQITGGTILHFTGAGEVGITAMQDGGVNHLPAPPVGQTIVVTKATATLTLAPLRQVHDGSPREVTPATEPPGLGHSVTYDGDPGAPVAIGSYEVTATLEDPLYQGSVTATLIVDDPAAMILVPGGELSALSSFGPLDEPTFALSRYEVTWGLWVEVRDWAVANGYDIGSSGAGCDDDHPVRGVSWYEAVKWCNARTEWENEMTGSSLAPAYRVANDVYRSGEPALIGGVVCDFGTGGYRLPTGAEWEFAARGGAGSAPQTYPGGENPDLLAFYDANSSGAVCDLSGGRGTHPVARKTANNAGFHDLAGNIAEWNWDAEPGNAAARLVAGGSWNSAAAGLAHGAIAGETPTLLDDRIGLRVGRSVALAIGEAVDLPLSEWDSEVGSAWFAQTGITHDGLDAAASGPLGDGGESHVQTSLTGPGNVTFRWKINLPAQSGKLLFSVGGTAATDITGDSGWVEATAYVPPGDQIVRWTYIRTVPEGQTADPVNTGAWLDEVVYTPAVAPEVITSPLTGIDDSRIIGGGELVSDGGSAVTARGLVIGVSPDPALGSGGTDFRALLEETTEYEVEVSPLLEGTTYHARAYATNAVGAGYGENVVFTTDTTLYLPTGLDEETRSILPGDRHVFHFNLAGAREVDFNTLGGASLRAELFDGEGNLVATFYGDSDVILEVVLYPGDYSLHLFRLPDPAGIAETFDLALDVTVVAEIRPDVAVGSSLTTAAGVGTYNTMAGQLVGYTSVKARKVSALATFRNAGTLPDELRIAGTPGNSLFRVAYTNASANITAQVITGTYQTPALAAGDEASWIRATVSPNKKKLTKKKKGKRSKILRRKHLLQIRASSVFDPALSDTGYISVQTK